MNCDFDGAGNLYNKYESNNPIVKLLMKKYISVFTSLIDTIHPQIHNIFEVGCGEGYMTNHIYQMGIPVIGSDNSSRIINVAKDRFPKLSFIVHSIYHLETMDQKFDLVVANEVLEHLEDPKGAIDSMKRISNKYLLISVPREPFFRFANLCRMKYISTMGNTPGHIQHWTVKQFKLFLKSEGLEIISFKSSTLWQLALCKIEK